MIIKDEKVESPLTKLGATIGDNSQIGINSTIHPGIKIENIKENTGFEILTPEKTQQTSPPTELELQLIREKIDPLNIRRLEYLSGKTREDALLNILDKELSLTI